MIVLKILLILLGIVLIGVGFFIFKNKANPTNGLKEDHYNRKNEKCYFVLGLSLFIIGIMFLIIGITFFIE